MKIRDMGMKETPKQDKKETISGLIPVERFPEKMQMADFKFYGSITNYRTHAVYDSMKHVMHNRNHTMPGVGRHS